MLDVAYENERKISIHTLTLRVTRAADTAQDRVNISIHTLTLRVTSISPDTANQILNFNPHPHTEGDKMDEFIRRLAEMISIHTLTLRVTRTRRRNGRLAVGFQSTPSH